MAKFIIILTLSFLIFSCGIDKNNKKSSTTNVSGKIFDSEGKSVTKASVIVRSQEMGRDTVALGIVKSDGTYEINLEKKGIFFIEFASPFHTPYYVEFVALELGSENSIDAHLAPYKYKEGAETIQLMSMSGGGAETMTLGEDGIYHAKFENNLDTFKYELSGHIDTKVGRTTNGTDHDFILYDGAGDWMSVIVGRKGEIEVSFDPGEFSREEKKASLSNMDPATKSLQSIMADLNNIVHYQYLVDTGAMEEALEYQTSFAKKIESLWKKEQNEGNKLYFAYKYFQLIDYGLNLGEKPDFINKEISAYLLSKLQPNSQLWDMNSFSWGAITIATLNDIDIYNNSFIDSLEKYQPLASERYHYRRILNSSDNLKDTANAVKLLEEYKEKYPKSRRISSLSFKLKKNKNIEHGKQSPDFKLASHDESGKMITLADYKGKYVLIDFWATWCGPCMREMPNIHDVYKKYSGKNFEILSLSFDRQEEDINKMREKGKYPMDWDHIFVEGGFSSDLAKDYEVLGIPKPILLDPQGKIIAFGGELRGEKLEKVLSENLGE